MSVADSSLGHVPETPRWEFDEGVTRVFEDMLDRSIPQYRVMRDLVTALGSRALSGGEAKHRGAGQAILDVGCSRGDAVAPFVARFPDLHVVGIEVAKPMLDAARARFAGNPRISIMDWDLRNGLPPYRLFDVALSILTLMFVPMERRLAVIEGIANGLAPGGPLIIVEKILGGSARIDAALVERYYAMKAANGYSQEEIERKRMALEGVLVPMPARWNEEMLRLAGFTEIDCFWRWCNFAGWIAYKR